MARHGACGPERCMTDVGYPFNLTLAYSKNMNLPENTFIFNMFVYVQHLVLNCWSLK